MTAITSLATDDREYLAIIYSFSGPSQLAFTCKELFIASIPFIPYSENISHDMARVIIECGSTVQRQKLFGCLNTRIIKRLLKDKSISPTYRKCRGLRLAVNAGRIDVVKLFAADDRVDINICDGVLLGIAAKNADRKMINYLLDVGIDPGNREFLEAAITGGDPKIVKLFIQTCPKSVKALRMAISSKNVGVVKMFLASKKYKNLSSHTLLLQKAMMTDDVEIISIIAPMTVAHCESIKLAIWRLIFASTSNASKLALNKALEDEGLIWPENATLPIISCIANKDLWPITQNMDITSVNILGDIAARMAPDHVYDFLMTHIDMWLNFDTFDDFRIKATPIIYNTTAPHRNISSFTTVVKIIIERGTKYVRWLQDGLRHYIHRMLNMGNNNQEIINALHVTMPIIAPHYLNAVMVDILDAGKYSIIPHIINTTVFRWYPNTLFADKMRELWTIEKNIYTMQIVSYMYSYGVHESWVLEAMSMYI